MKPKSTILAATLLGAAFTTAEAKTIRHDSGGLISQKVIEVATARRSGEIVRIDGYCASACTLHVSNPRACATSRAVLAFHAASNVHGTKYLWSKYPAKIRVYITTHGGLTKSLIVVKGKEAQRLIGTC